MRIRRSLQLRAADGTRTFGRKTPQVMSMDGCVPSNRRIGRPMSDEWDISRAISNQGPLAMVFARTAIQESRNKPAASRQMPAAAPTNQIVAAIDAHTSVCAVLSVVVRAALEFDGRI